MAYGIRPAQIFEQVSRPTTSAQGPESRPSTPVRSFLISVDPFALPQTWSAQATLAFGSIPNASCAPNLTIGLLGALPGDGILAGWPASLPPGLLGQMSVAQPNFVSVTICNLTGTSTMLPALTYTATIVLSFDTAVSGEALSKLSQITIPIDDRTIMATSVDVCSESRRLRALDFDRSKRISLPLGMTGQIVDESRFQL